MNVLRRVVAVLAVLFCSLEVRSEEYPKQLLQKTFNEIKADKPFKCGTDWVRYPAYEDRQAWEELLGSHAGRLIKEGEKYLNFEWHMIKATQYLAFERTGERQIMEVPFHENRVALNALMLAELAEGKGRFIDQMLNGVWQMCHMPSWVRAAHIVKQPSKRALPDPRFHFIALSSCQIGVQVSFIHYFFKDVFDAIDPVITYVMETAVKEHILDPYLDAGKMTSQNWMNLMAAKDFKTGNWNPWCNGDSMLCFLLMEKEPSRLRAAIEQALRSVDKFMDYTKDDGCCDEGTVYWQHAAGKMFCMLKTLYDASGGKFDVFDVKKIRDMGEYISKSYIADRWVVNFADATGKVTPPYALIYNYGKMTGSKEMMDFAKYLCYNNKKGCFNPAKPVIGFDVLISLEALMNVREFDESLEELNRQCTDAASAKACLTSLRESVPDFVWYPQTEVCYMKNEKNWFIAAKGGHNDENHNHNDVGSFILFVDNVPMFIDAGVGTYTKQTFNRERYNIWTMQSSWHNLPDINGIAQRDGRKFRANDVSATDSKKGNVFTVDIHEAYPEDACCDSWKRTVSLDDSCLKVTESYRLSKRVAPDVIHYLVQGKVYLPGEEFAGRILKNGELIVENKGKSVVVRYPNVLTASVEDMEFTDKRLANVWGNVLRRISFTTSENAPVRGKYVFEISEIK